MAKSPYAIDPHLTGIAIAYKNDNYIADLVAPYQTVNKEEFQWDQYGVDEMYTIPDTKVGRLSAPNQVSFSSTRITDSTNDYGLDSPVPQKDIDNADDNQDPLGYATEGVMELVKLDREKRLADKVFDLNTYLATQRITLSGASQFSNAASSPIATINAGLDLCLIRPNKMILGQVGWTGLRSHPEIVEAVVKTGAQRGMASKEAVAELFELEEVVVGRGWVNSAKPGQAATRTRLWGKHITLAYINPMARLQGAMMPTFMMTARFGTPTSGTIPSAMMGLKGGVMVRAGEQVKEVTISNLCAYHIKDAVA